MELDPRVGICLITSVFSFLSWLFQGRKSRRERLNWKENHPPEPRLPTPPSYAQRGSPTYETYEGDRERYLDIEF